MQVDLETVCPSGQGSSQEYRLLVAAQPLRVRLNQSVFKFLRGLVETLSASSGDESSPDEAVSSAESDPLSAGESSAQGP